MVLSLLLCACCGWRGRRWSGLLCGLTFWMFKFICCWLNVFVFVFVLGIGIGVVFI